MTGCRERVGVEHRVSQTEGAWPFKALIFHRLAAFSERSIVIIFIIAQVTQLVGLRAEPSDAIFYLLCAFYICKVLLCTFISPNELYSACCSHFKDEAAEVGRQSQLNVKLLTKSCFPCSSSVLPSCLDRDCNECRSQGWRSVGRVLRGYVCDRKRPLGDTATSRDCRQPHLSTPSALESPRLCSPGTAVPSPRSSDSGPPGMLWKPQAHIFRQPLAGHRSSPGHLVNLGQICSDFVWAAGFHQEGAESSNPRRAESGRSRASAPAHLPLLLCNAL